MQSRFSLPAPRRFPISGRALCCGLALAACLSAIAREAAAIPPLPPLPITPQHYGNDVDFVSSSFHSANYLLGSKISVPSDILLLDVGIIFKSRGYSANVGIYSDVGGHPNQLLATTDPFAVNSTGVVETPVTTPVILPAGDYWFQAVYSADARVGYLRDGVSQVDYVSHNFSNPLPASASWTTYNYEQFNYYLVGVPTAVPEPSTVILLGCGALGLVAFARGRRKRS